MIGFTIHGAVSKKNAYTPGPRGMHKNQELQAALDDMISQVPGEVRDLRLEHPDIIFEINSRTSRRDRDNIVTTLLDILVTCGVLVDDSIAHCNGVITILPANIGEEDSTRIVIYPK